MRQRSCSHRVSELYNEVILTTKFQKEFCNRDSFYTDNIYCSAFWSKNFQVKLLIIDKENQEIIYENICDETLIFFNDLKTDTFMYAIDVSNSVITKFNNLILNYGKVNNSYQEHHTFIKLSKSINDIVVKDDVIYFSVNLPTIRIEEDKNINLSYTKGEHYLTPIDTVVKNINIENCFILIGIDTNSLFEIKRHIFNDRNTEINFSKIAVNRKNSLLIEVYDDYFMEDISYFVDFSKNIIKQLHPPHLTLINDSYLLILPLYAYNTYSDFKLIRLSDLLELDLYNILNNALSDNLDDISRGFYNDVIVFISDNTLAIGDFYFNCSNLFESNKNFNSKIEPVIQKLRSLIPITGKYFDGYALEIHTIKSTLKEDGSFETLRTDLGELLYKLKYNFDKNSIENIAQRCAETIGKVIPNVDVIIPSPPSNLNRPFQPVYELAKRISEITKIPFDIDYVTKLPTEQIKTLADQEDRNLILDRAISINDKKYKDKNILLFDDLFRSGDTLNVIAKKLKINGGVNSIKAICVTKTRTKR